MDKEKFSHNKIDTGDWESGFESDPAIKAVMDKKKLQKQAGIFEITRTLQDSHAYAGTSTKEEIKELECNMRYLLNENKYGYSYLQNYLRQLGYREDLIRQTFRKLTGADPDIYQDIQPVLDTPGTIPGINYGWGKSKSKQYDFYFIMPYNLGYQVFGQKGDLQRDEVIYFLELEKAREYVEKHTHELMVWDKVKKHNIKDKQTSQELSEPLPIGIKTARYKQLVSDFDKMGDRITYTERRAAIKDAFSSGKLSQEETAELLNKYAFNKFANPEHVVKDISEKEMSDSKEDLAEELEQDAEKLMEKPIEEELEEVSPSSFFESQKGDRMQDDLHTYIKDVTDYLSNVNAELSGFAIGMKSFKYMKKSTSSRIEDNVVAPGENVEEIFLSGATIAVVISIKDMTASSGRNEKMGFTLFTVLDGELLTSGTFKGEDNKVYSLSEEGFQKYFYEERNQGR